MGGPRRNLVLGAAVAVSLAVSVACSTGSPSAADGVAVTESAGPEQSAVDPMMEGPTTGEGSAGGEPSSAPSGLDGLVAQAVADLQARLDVDAAAVSVVSAGPMVWPDTGMGCRQPGMSYLQVPQDGALVVLAAAGREYRYHSGGRASEPFLCEPPAAGARTTPDPRPSPRS